MRVKREFRDRDEVQVEVLSALVDRKEEGMTVFEIRSHVETDIDDLETALADLKSDGLITTEEGDHRTVIKPDQRVVPDPNSDDEEGTLLDKIRERLPL